MADYRGRFGQITNAEIYLGDNTLVGLAKTFKMPKIEWKTVDIETLGQVAVYKAPTRTLEALTGELTMSSVDPELQEAFLNPTVTHTLQLHKYVDVNGSEGADLERSYTLVTVIQARFFGHELGESKNGDAEEQTHEMSISRLVQRIHDSNQPLIEVDVFASSVRNSSGEMWRR
ncbi:MULTISPECIES: phage major tail tube protein [Stappiaceae]|uniref:phage major tail tube protein n=1 Tax=Stappiaceae TaxID=2821832 RepID=UPI000C9AC46E|nr:MULTISPECIES: phage major tail tube protein [Pseudovibrio]MDD7908639.1 phage major tail tube protein [Pseudovibrio exalbescens]MDX5595319.1 phage major tail tube protein [Pseudovibrio sp. SPO723]